MDVSIEKVKKLREETNISLGECKKALGKSEGDLEEARGVLRKKEKELAKKRSGRETGEGVIESYVHGNGKVGVLLDLRSETDFVARSDKFKELAHMLAMQIAAMAPRFVSFEDISQELLGEWKEEWKKEFSEKPDDIVEDIIEGKVEKMKKKICLLDQPFIKNEDKSVRGVIAGYAAGFGENLKVKRFVRYEI